MVNSKISKHFPSFQILQMTERVHVLIYTQILSTLSRNYLYVYIISTKAHMGKGHVLSSYIHPCSPMAPKKGHTHLGDHRDHPSVEPHALCWEQTEKMSAGYGQPNLKDHIA